MKLSELQKTCTILLILPKAKDTPCMTSKVLKINHNYDLLLLQYDKGAIHDISRLERDCTSGKRLHVTLCNCTELNKTSLKTTSSLSNKCPPAFR